MSFRYLCIGVLLCIEVMCTFVLYIMYTKPDDGLQ
jgi:hypothetical protein